MVKRLLALALVVLTVAMAASSCPGGRSAQNQPYGPEVAKGGGAGAPKAMDAIALGTGAPEIGKPMPDVQFTSLDGKTHKLSEYKGKAVFVNFWGTWCPPCVKEIPDLVALYNGNKGKGFEMVGLAVSPDDLAAVKKFNEKNRLPYLLAMSSDALKNQFGFRAVPTTVAIDKAGVVRDVLIGARSKAEYQSVLDKYI